VHSVKCCELRSIGTELRKLRARERERVSFLVVFLHYMQQCAKPHPSFKAEAVAGNGKQSLLSKQASTGSLSRDCKGRIEEKSKEEEVRGRKGEKVLFSCCKAFLSYSLNPSPLHIT